LFKVLFGETPLEVFLVEFASQEECLDMRRVDSQDDGQIVNSPCGLVLLVMEFGPEQIGFFLKRNPAVRGGGVE
jgi:hypothetical protein